MALSPDGSEAARGKFLSRLSQRVQSAKREIRQGLGFTGSIEIFDHHQSHAASSFFFSGFDEAAVLTTDGVGEWATTTFGRAAGAEIELFEAIHFPNSLGLFYSAVTAYLGFDVNDGEQGMGLAPSGEPRFVEQVRALLTPGKDGQYRLNMEYFDFLRRDRMYSDRFVDLFGVPPRAAESEILAFHQDVARSAQWVLEELLLEKVRYLHDRVPSRNLCMAGGVALNCVANGRIPARGSVRADVHPTCR